MTFRIKAEDSQLRQSLVGAQVAIRNTYAESSDVDRALAHGSSAVSQYGEGAKARALGPLSAFMSALSIHEQSSAPGMVDYTNRYNLISAQLASGLNQYRDAHFYGNMILGQSFAPNVSTAATASRMAVQQAYAGLPTTLFGGDRSMGALLARGNAQDYKYLYEARFDKDFYQTMNQLGTGNAIVTSARMNQVADAEKSNRGLALAMGISGGQYANISDSLLKSGTRPGDLGESLKAYTVARGSGISDDTSMAMVDMANRRRRMSERWGTGLVQLEGSDALKTAGLAGNVSAAAMAYGYEMTPDERNSLARRLYAMQQANGEKTVSDNSAMTALQMSLGLEQRRGDFQNIIRDGRMSADIQTYNTQANAAYALRMEGAKEMFSNPFAVMGRSFVGSLGMTPPTWMPGFNAPLSPVAESLFGATAQAPNAYGNMLWDKGSNGINITNKEISAFQTLAQAGDQERLMSGIPGGTTTMGLFQGMGTFAASLIPQSAKDAALGSGLAGYKTSDQDVNKIINGAMKDDAAKTINDLSTKISGDIETSYDAARGALNGMNLDAVGGKPSKEQMERLFSYTSSKNLATESQRASMISGDPKLKEMIEKNPDWLEKHPDAFKSFEVNMKWAQDIKFSAYGVNHLGQSAFAAKGEAGRLTNVDRSAGQKYLMDMPDPTGDKAKDDAKALEIMQKHPETIPYITGAANKAARLGGDNGTGRENNTGNIGGVMDTIINNFTDLKTLLIAGGSRR